MRERSFMKSLFFGVIDEGLIFPWPQPNAQEVDTVRTLLESVRRFFDRRVDSAKIDREQQIGDDILLGLKELGLFGMLVPQSHGGAGLTNTGYARVVQEVAGFDASIAVTLGAHQSIGMKGLLLFGSDELKTRYLPRLATGEMVAAFALTEPGAGSDAAALQTRAERRDDGYVLSGSKIRITNGGFADLFTVFARTSPADEGVKPENHCVSRRARLGREERAERAQARHPWELDDRAVLRRRPGSFEPRAR